MDLDLTGKTALVSGSTAGIGLAVASGLAGQGATVWVNGRTQERVAQAVATIRDSHPHATLRAAVGDVSAPGGADTVASMVGAVDILVNNVGGIGGPQKPFEALDEAAWDRVWQLNVMSAVRLTRHALPAMRERNWGRLIFVSSESGVQIPTEFIHYGVAKAGVIALARGIAETLAGTGITSNSVLPGPTFAEGAVRRMRERGITREELEQDMVQAVRPTTLIRRYATTDEVANMVVYLCSPAASATQGASLRVDGGVIKSAF